MILDHGPLIDHILAEHFLSIVTRPVMIGLELFAILGVAYLLYRHGRIALGRWDLALLLAGISGIMLFDIIAHANATHGLGIPQEALIAMSRITRLSVIFSVILISRSAHRRQKHIEAAEEEWTQI